MTTYILTFYSSLSANDRYRMRDENGTAIPDADLATIFGSNGKARFILDWDGKKSSSPSKIEIRNSGNTVVMSYTAQKALLPAQLYEGTWTGGASTFTSFTPVEGKTLSEDELNFLMRQIKSAQASGIKTLTAADYNYPTSGTKTAVDFSLLEPGFYKVGENIAFRPGTGNQFLLQAGNILIRYQGTGANYGIYSTDNALVQVVNGNALKILSQGDIVDNLNSQENSRPLSAKQGKVLKNLIDSLVIKNAGTPTTATVGTVGMLYEDTTNGKLYQCTAIDNTDPQNIVYTWTEVGGSSVNVVQTTGTSTADVMSQNAVTSMIYADPSTRQKVRIGSSADGSGANATAVGYSAEARGLHSTALGFSAKANQSTATAVGRYATAVGEQSVAIGNMSNAFHKESVAFSGATTSVQGEFAIGVSGDPGNGYNSSNYRLLTGVYDGQSAHDAATVGQIGSTISDQDFATLLNGTGA